MENKTRRQGDSIIFQLIVKLTYEYPKLHHYTQQSTMMPSLCRTTKMQTVKK